MEKAELLKKLEKFDLTELQLLMIEDHNFFRNN